MKISVPQDMRDVELHNAMVTVEQLYSKLACYLIHTFHNARSDKGVY